MLVRIHIYKKNKQPKVTVMTEQDNEEKKKEVA